MSTWKIFFTCFALLCLDVHAKKKAPPAAQEQLAEIDDQIRDLEELKRGYESKALRHEDQAIRLQLIQEWYLEVRRHLELAEDDRQKAALIQEEIDRLQKKRKELLDRYGGLDGFEDL